MIGWRHVQSADATPYLSLAMREAEASSFPLHARSPCSRVDLSVIM